MSEIVKRNFILGDEWLYYKIYCGVRTADIILEELVAPMAKELLKSALIDQWFFVRYSNPYPHLRLRFKLIEIEKISAIISKVKTCTSPYLQESLIWKIQVGTYTRELERYGRYNIESSELLFFYDSTLIMSALTQIKDEELWFLFILKCVHRLLDVFQLTDNEKLGFYKQNTIAYKEEFNVVKITKISLDKKYRGLQKQISDIMSDAVFSENYPSLKKMLQEYTNKIIPLSKTILENLVEEPISNILGSYIHMFINRAFRDKQRFYEMVAYDFLNRYQKQCILKK